MEDFGENEIISSDHDLLLSAVTKLDKTQHISEPTRNEPTNVNSEFNLIKRTNKLEIKNVVKVLEDTDHHRNVGKKLKKSNDASKILPLPLEKPQAERIKRSTGYSETKTRVGRWDPVVARSRTVDFVSFPIKHVSNKRQPTQDFLSKLKLKSPLELELEQIDPPAATIEEEDEEQIYPMSYEEMLEHRQQSAKLRAQQSYKAAKAKRQGKIKSKKYHRILKKEKLKQQLKEFEELQKTDPEEALLKLEALEKARALERHTLRHKNTGKWAKSQLVRAKYDKDARQQLAEQLAVSKNLSHKTEVGDDSEEEGDNQEGIPDVELTQDPLNPWMVKQSNKTNVSEEFNFGYKKYLKDKITKAKDNSDTESENELENSNKSDFNLLKCKINNLETTNNVSVDNEEDNLEQHAYVKVNSKSMKSVKMSKKLVATSNWIVESIDNRGEIRKSVDIATVFEKLETDISTKIEDKLQLIRKNIDKLEKRTKAHKKNNVKQEFDNLEYLKIKSKKVKPLIDEELNETGSKTVEESNSIKQTNKLINLHEKKLESNNQDSNIDPDRFINVQPKYLNSSLPDNDKNLDDLDDEQVVPKVNIEEVFEEDDVVASFRQEKEDETNKDQPQDIDLSLPGWGNWGGKGVKPQKRKKNRFILKAPPKMPRRDENKGDVIIKEYKDEKLSSHKVADVPFPFSSVKDFEASIRAPIGNTFIPENAFKSLIKPSVITKAGAIIEPMDEEELLIPKNKKFKNHKIIKLLGKK